ncbi:NAD(P)-binding protein [Zopfia rhizophila CBS 207.26]|uniref:NAD(P)-binding protein n=1 Tax=Zopfia rhizophila CBS 207.26 TaxID=1314779 RepID=A0A6A6EEN0_9PEZI|nr:NAD(P)-binding protein [Zopfia rhizophila CBS 207.26]
MKKAAQRNPVQKKVVVNEVPIPSPDPGQFLVKLAFASLCHSDLMSMTMEHKEPITIGHEVAGYIHKIHPTAENKGFQVGDAIDFTYTVDFYNECEGCAVHSNYCLVNNSWVLAFHCIDSCRLKLGQWLAIIGCGGLGQLACQYAKVMGFKVIGVNINDDILNTVKSQRCRRIEEAKSFMDRGPNKGADAVAVFSAADAAYRSAPSLVKLGGIIIVIGLLAKGVTVDALDIARDKYRRHKSLDAVNGLVERMKKGEIVKRQLVQLALVATSTKKYFQTPLFHMQ